jgi:hypothetical protein
MVSNLMPPSVLVLGTTLPPSQRLILLPSKSGVRKTFLAGDGTDLAGAGKWTIVGCAAGAGGRDKITAVVMAVNPAGIAMTTAAAISQGENFILFVSWLIVSCLCDRPLGFLLQPLLTNSRRELTLLYSCWST